MYRKECLCGNSRPTNAQIVSDDNCDIQCSGDPSQNCSGGWRIALYRTGGATKPTGKLFL